MNNDIENRRQFIKEIQKRTGYQRLPIDEILIAIEEILTDAVLYEKNVKVRGLFSLEHKDVKGYDGVNAYQSKIKGETVHQKFDDFKKTYLVLSENIRLARNNRK